ncbi:MULTISPECIES: hypothetical protein [unclassified Streptomyces]|uniref:SCO2584 family spore wall biosynthesis protein n=1 Tax=unclassified Streptomyces TaxID=2593676 RepID=UPI00136A3D83|nr:hypothetical protein [Streptomyces sp. SHP 1-2]MCW5248939.1 hypothetical protein [Streptomyces sp. SHP 1-2]MYU21024.1 hypothetical protein [Streptomyces sp. SID8352]
MPEDVGGSPFPDGWNPDDDHDRGGSDEEFASVVFDEDFVRAATVREPSAVERLLAAAEARAEAAEAEAAHRGHARGERYDDGYDPFGPDSDLPDPDDDVDPLDRPYGAPATYGPVRWHRPVAWLLALLMGIGMVALAFVAVYRGAAAGGAPGRAPAPASTGPEQGGALGPSGAADRVPSAVPALPGGP